MDREIKIMVSSSVYGFENELEQIIATLSSFGYYVMNSHVGTIRVHPRRSNLDNCLQAVEECDLFLGIIRPFMGTGYIRRTIATSEGNTKSVSNITFEEIKKAIELKKPYWFLVHRDVVFASKLFGKIQNSETILENNKSSLRRDRFFDPLCLKVYDYVIRNRIASNWVQEYYKNNEMMDYLRRQFGDRIYIIENILTQED